MESLYYLLEVSKCKSLSEASQKLYLTPQALSISIKKLEQELNLQLLVRSNKGVTLTEAGWKLANSTQNYLNEIYALAVDSNRNLFVYKGKLDIYSNKGSSTILLPSVISHLYECMSEVEIDLHVLKNNEILKLILEDTIPYAFFSQFYIKDTPVNNISDHIIFSPLIQANIVCYVPSKFPIAAKDFLTLDDLEGYSLISSDNANNSIVNLLDTLRDSGIKSKVYLVKDFFSTMQLLKAELGVVLRIVLPYQGIEYFSLKNVKIIPLIEDIKLYFGYITRATTGRMEPIHQLLLNYIGKNIDKILQGENGT